MKNNIREKFKNNILVRPLYRKLKNGNKINPKSLITVDTNIDLDGVGFRVKRKIVSINNVSQPKTHKERSIFSAWNSNHINESDRYRLRTFCDGVNNRSKMLDGIEDRISDNDIERKQDKTNKLVQSEDKGVLIQTVSETNRVPNTWLRLYPLPKLTEESVCSVIFRCILCQLGLSTILVLWTVVWVFGIHAFEGPYEAKVSFDFEKEQNHLVIDLATELRQVQNIK